MPDSRIVALRSGLFTCPRNSSMRAQAVRLSLALTPLGPRPHSTRLFCSCIPVGRTGVMTKARERKRISRARTALRLASRAVPPLFPRTEHGVMRNRSAVPLRRRQQFSADQPACRPLRRAFRDADALGQVAVADFNRCSLLLLLGSKPEVHQKARRLQSSPCNASQLPASQ